MVLKTLVRVAEASSGVGPPPIRRKRIWASWPVQAVEEGYCVGMASVGGQCGHRFGEEGDQLGAGDWCVGDQVEPGPGLVGR